MKFVHSFPLSLLCFFYYLPSFAQNDVDYLDYAKIPKNLKMLVVWNGYVASEGDSSITEKSIYFKNGKTLQKPTNDITIEDEKGRIKIKTEKFSGFTMDWYQYPTPTTTIHFYEDIIRYKYKKTEVRKDEKGRVTREEIYDSTFMYIDSGMRGAEHTVTNYTYKNNLLVKQQTFKLPNYTTKEEVEYSYDSKDRLIKEDRKQYYANGKAENKLDKQIITIYNYYNYGEERLFIKSITEISPYSVTSKSWKYEYKANKMILTKEETYSDVDTFVYEFIYEDEMLIRVNELKNSRYTHQEGNWTEYEYIFE